MFNSYVAIVQTRSSLTINFGRWELIWIRHSYIKLRSQTADRFAHTMSMYLMGNAARLFNSKVEKAFEFANYRESRHTRITSRIDWLQLIWSHANSRSHSCRAIPHGDRHIIATPRVWLSDQRHRLRKAQKATFISIQRGLKEGGFFATGRIVILFEQRERVEGGERDNTAFLRLREEKKS